MKGSCLCGQVCYRIKGVVRDVVNCFCEQCRKTSGHYVAATRVNKNNLVLSKQATLNWYESSEGVFRGFCSQCGANLFWDDGYDEQISIMAGTLDSPTGLTTIANIFTQDASDYFEIPRVDS
ncbi:MAG: GFA family protein [Enterobacterales bacterium]|nr:GFA family protein [Enterobacterales bacterium]